MDTLVASALNVLLFLYYILRFNGNICSALRQNKMAHSRCWNQLSVCEVYFIFVCVFFFWLQGNESKLNILWTSGPINCPPGVIFADASSFSDDLLGLLLLHGSSPLCSCGFPFIALLFPQGDPRLGSYSSFVYTLNVCYQPEDCSSATSLRNKPSLPRVFFCFLALILIESFTIFSCY